MLKVWTTSDRKDKSLLFRKILSTISGVEVYYDIINQEFIPVPVKGEVVLVSGSRLVDVCRTEGIFPKNRTISSLREIPVLSRDGGYYLVTFDPYMINSDPELETLIRIDVQLAIRLICTGTINPEVGMYEYVNTFAPLIEYIEEVYSKTGKAVDVSMDTETMGFYPWYPDKDIVSISFSAINGTAQVLYLGSKKPPVPVIPGLNLYSQVSWLLQSPKVKLRAANGKYDLIWIATKWGIECTNFVFDTMLVGSLLNENRSNSLNLHTKIYTSMGGYDDQFNRTKDKSHMERLLPDRDYLVYSGGDADATLRVASCLKAELVTDERLAKFYKIILHPAARAFEKLERRGVLLDVDAMHQLKSELLGVINSSYKKAISLLPMRLQIKHAPKIKSQMSEGKSPLFPSLLKEFFFSKAGLDLKPKMYTGKTNEPSTAKQHLRQFADVPAASAMVEVLTEADVAAKTLSTFVDGFLKHVRPDGKLHPIYFLARGDYEGRSEGDDSGTLTGRTSCKDPPFQIIPKRTKWAKKVRKCYKAPKGMSVLSCDYEQGELKVIADVAQETNMLKAYSAGLDIHAVTGAKLLGVDLKEFMSWKNSDDKELLDKFDKYRGRAKAINFGRVYGMQDAGFVAYAWMNYGLKLTIEEAKDWGIKFFELYPKLLDYHEIQRRFVRHNGFVISPLGRVRHLPGIWSKDREVQSRAERQAINSPVQSALNDLMFLAIAEIEAKYPDGPIQMVGVIHDALISYVPTEEVSFWAKEVTGIMANLPIHKLNWHPSVKFTADAECGPNLGEMSKLVFN